MSDHFTDYERELAIQQARQHAKDMGSGHDVHVVPDEEFEHEQSEDCVCGPSVEFTENGGKFYVHHELVLEVDDPRLEAPMDEEQDLPEQGVPPQGSAPPDQSGPSDALTGMVIGLEKRVVELERKVTLQELNQIGDDQLNRKQALAICHYVGFRLEHLVEAVSIMGAESARRYLRVGVNPDGSHDRGLFQINDEAHPDLSDVDAFLPIPNARFAYELSNGGLDWKPWAAYNTPAYLQNMPLITASLAAEKAGVWKKSIKEREAVFERVGDLWVPDEESP